MLDVMLDPPREVQAVKGQNGRFFRRVATKPTNPSDGDNDLEWVKQTVERHGDVGLKRQLKAGKGFTVRHLLLEADENKNRKDTRAIIGSAINSGEKSLRKLRGGDTLKLSNKTVDGLLDGLTDLLVRSGARPQEFAEEIARVHKGLVMRARDANNLAVKTDDFVKELSNDAPMVRRLGLESAESLAEVYSAIALIMTFWTDDAFLKSVERTSFDPDQVRRQLKLKALQGGSMIDFWSQEPAFNPTTDEGLRGELYPAYKMLGLGINITDVPASTIAELTDTTTNSFIQIKTRAASGAYGTATTLLLPNDIERANKSGMAFSPTVPRAAELNFDLVRSDPPTNTHPDGKPRINDAQEPGFKTGNGAVEVHITPAHPRYLQRDKAGQIVEGGAKVATETAFNIYAVWQGAEGMDEYFLDTSKVPPLDKLRPYLVTRRYSYQRDLHGAFPDIGGSPHPALERILNTPPWEAILRRPEKVKDFNDYQVDTENSRSEESAPDVPDDLYGGADGPTIFSFDLRRGLDAQNTPPSGLINAWDPRAETDYLWSPIKYRGQSDNMDRPQAYRFFVTSVDSFDVESNAMPVKAKDLDTGAAGDEYLFLPTYRTQVGAPDNLSLVFDPAATDKKLTLSWTMEAQPEEYGLRATLKAFEANGHALKATVRFFKRRIVGSNVQDDVIALREQETAGDIYWRGVTGDLLKRGWEPMPGKDIVVDQKAVGGATTVDLDLEYADLGYEYTAGVSIAIPDKAKAFWSAAAERRRMFYLERDQNSDENIVKQSEIIDAPAASTVAMSDVITVPNADLPRGPIAGTPLETMAFAKAVIPLPGIQRDPILARIATMPNSEDEKTLTKSRSGGPFMPARIRTPWLDTGYVLNEGQTASAEGALRRTLDSLRTVLGDRDLDIGDDILHEPRRLLARSFLRFAENAQNPNVDINLSPEVGLHPSIGFRGILRLQWGYIPHIRSTPMQGEAEATAFDIFQAIVPNGEDETRVQARSVLPLEMAPKDSAAVTDHGYAVSVSLDAGSESEQTRLLARLQSGTQPICGLFKPSDEDEMLPFDVTQVSLSGSILNISATPMNGSLGSGSGTVFLFFAVAVTHIVADGLDVPGSETEAIPHSVLLPVPGGESEFGFWYIVPRSGANRRGTHDRRIMVMRELADTIEPSAPDRVDLFPPLDRERVSLNPNNQVHKDFLPSAIDTPEDARSNPRLVLTWAPAEDDNLRVVIYRQEERIDQEDDRQQLRGLNDYIQFENIEAIRSLPEDGILDPALLVALSKPETGWLSGAQVETAPNAKTPDTPFVAAEASLSAHDGLEIDIDNGMAGFIDYRQTEANSLDAMDGNFRYRYQVQFARPLPHSAGKARPENAPSYLFSPVTAWTDWMVPEAPPIKASYALLSVEATPEAFNPEVEFQFEVGPSKALAQILRNRDALEDELDWAYRVVIRRRLSVLSPAEEGTKTVLALKEVGMPLTINPKTPNEVFRVTDTRIERNYEDEELSLHYEIFIQQFALRQTPNGLVEQPVRSHEETPTIVIPKVPIRPPRGLKEAGMEIRRPIRVTIT